MKTGIIYRNQLLILDEDPKQIISSVDNRKLKMEKVHLRGDNCNLFVTVASYEIRQFPFLNEIWIL